MIRTLTSRQLAFDVSLAAVCVVARWFITIHEAPLVPVVLLMAGALALRRVSPALALAIAWVGALLQLSFGLGPDVSNLAILPVLYATAAYGGPRMKWLGLISAGVGAIVAGSYLTLY